MASGRWAPIHFAAKSGVLAMLDWELLGSSMTNLPVNLATSTGLTMLHLAAWNGRAASIALLLGAWPDQRQRHGSNPWRGRARVNLNVKGRRHSELDLALSQGYIDSARLLLRAGCQAVVFRGERTDELLHHLVLLGDGVGTELLMRSANDVQVCGVAAVGRGAGVRPNKSEGSLCVWGLCAPTWSHFISSFAFARRSRLVRLGFGVVLVDGICYPLVVTLLQVSKVLIELLHRMKYPDSCTFTFATCVCHPCHASLSGCPSFTLCMCTAGMPSPFPSTCTSAPCVPRRFVWCAPPSATVRMDGVRTPTKSTTWCTWDFDATLSVAATRARATHLQLLTNVKWKGACVRCVFLLRHRCLSHPSV